MQARWGGARGWGLGVLEVGGWGLFGEVMVVAMSHVSPAVSVDLQKKTLHLCECSKTQRRGECFVCQRLHSFRIAVVAFMAAR